MRRRALVAAVAVGYPIWVLASDGAPRFPGRSDCARPATRDGAIEAVFGRFDTQREAALFRDRIAGYGWASAVVERGGCGEVEVVVRGIESLEAGRGLIEEARTVDLHPSLEQAD